MCNGVKGVVFFSAQGGRRGGSKSIVVLIQRVRRAECSLVSTVRLHVYRDATVRALAMLSLHLYADLPDQVPPINTRNYTYRTGIYSY